MNKYKVGIYLRLSSSDGDSIESQSIDNQRLIITNYINSHQEELYFVQEYIDDGYSGSNFERPAWNRLLKDIKLNIIDTIITKDLSRMGRDYISMGTYIEKLFPQNKIRYIAINDDIDTLYETPGLDYLQFKLIFNDLYLKDISKKIRKELTEKKKSGKYTGWKAPYGYKKSKSNKYELVIDTEASTVVKYIFEIAQYNNIRNITNILNEQKIKTPSQYANLPNQSEYWSPKTIKEILSNELYIGKLIQGKRKKINYKTKKEEKVLKKDWIIVNKPNLAIIDKNLFNSVNTLQVSKYKRKNNHKTLLFYGLLRCKECKHALIINTNPKNNRHYTMCSYYLKNTKIKLCTTHSNNYDNLENSLLQHIKQLIKDNVDPLKLKQILLNNIKNNTLHKKEDNLLKEKQKIINNINKIYEDKINESINLINYEKLINKYQNKIKEIDNELKKIKKSKYANSSIDNIIDDYLNLKNINNEFISRLIQYIEISNEKEITIHYNFII